MRIEITRLAKTDGPLTKRIRLTDEGTIISDGSACVMSAGAACRVRLDTLGAFSRLIQSLEPHEAIALGALREDLPDQINIVTKAKLNGHAPTTPTISRSAGQIIYRPGCPALALLDYDVKGMPDRVRTAIAEAGGFRNALERVLPALAEINQVRRSSTSSGLRRVDTGAALSGSTGVHVYLLVEDGSDVERFLRVLHARCWLAGFGWLMVGAGGQLLERSIVDRMVGKPERLVFEAPPILAPPLVQDTKQRVPVVTEGRPLDTGRQCLDLSTVERAQLHDLRQAEAQRLAPVARIERAAFIKQQAERIVELTSVAPDTARRMVEKQCDGILLPHIELLFDAPEFAGATVADVLADPERFDGATLADPLEGLAYGACKAKVMRRADGTPWIHSFAHGRTTYELRHDAASVEAAIAAADPKVGSEPLVRLMVNADRTEDDEQHLRGLIMKKTGLKPRPLNATIKAAHAAQAKQKATEAGAAAAAQRTDKRPRIEAPAPDGERLPVMKLLDDILANTGEAEPPMRDLSGLPVEVRARPPLMLHELSAAGANQDEAAKTRLPPPALPLLTRHDKYSLAHTIERYVEFTAETAKGVRSVALAPTFVEHYMAYRDSVLPTVGAIVTAPLVLPDGTFLAPTGLDRDRKLVFRIEADLIRQMPRNTPTEANAAVALDFLTNDWLCDVATDLAGKCVLIAKASTILERVLLPERPAFFITAGKRGGGKTTVLTMIILAVTGKKPPAAAWSSNEEERRKAMLAYLAEGLAALIWDNIPLGSMISCPTLEKVLTTDAYSDRKLGETTNMTVPAFTIMAFTGNNIGPKGDLASRSLVARIDVDRPDPENRPFRHIDPIAWTLDNRGKILRALYTILLANPQLKPESRREPKTRFKTWWHLVGSAVENAAATLTALQAEGPVEQRIAKPVDFVALFAGVEGDDEETASLIDVLGIIHNRWPKSFQAADVARFVNEPPLGDEEDAGVLCAFFDPSGRRLSQLSSIAAGKRLGAVVDTPVSAGNSTMKLTRTAPTNQPQQRKTGWFQIRVTGA